MSLLQFMIMYFYLHMKETCKCVAILDITSRGTIYLCQNSIMKMD